MYHHVQYLRELAMLEMIYYDQNDVWLPTDPGAIQGAWPMVVVIQEECSIAVCQFIGGDETKFSSWGDKEAVLVGKVSCQL